MKEKTYTRKQILEAISYWEGQLRKGNYRRVDEGKVGDFFGKLFQTRKFLAKQAELEKAAKEKADAEFAKKHPLAAVASKMDKASADYSSRFTNADVENGGYPWDMSSEMDCIAVRLWGVDTVGADRGSDVNIEDDEDDIMKLFKQCGGPDNCEFYVINNLIGVIMPNIGTGFIKKVNEGEGGEFEEIDDIVAFLKDKDVKWTKATKTKPVNAVQAKGGEKVTTVGSDGNEETSRTAKEGDWIVNNVGNPDNKWIVGGDTFKRKYKADDKKKGQYVPWDGKKDAPPPPMLAAKVSDVVEGGKGVKFAPPNWGGDVIQIKNDGWFMKDPDNEKDIYAISKPDFDSSYELK